MSTLIKQLPAEIARLEAKHGSDNHFVKGLKQQLAAMKETSGKATQDVYRMQAAKFQPSSAEPQRLPDLQNLPEDPALGAMRADAAARSKGQSTTGEQEG